ncbi:MAG: HAMP domain-containing histidine kinase, partial [Alphaproteobacteria bacterium]|nr:HAMP domain-containing histidine kinase [Alphaproteobacteria bacterium]
MLTIVFVMVSEVLIFAPSVSRFRLDYLGERLAAAHLASLALQVPPDNVLSEQLGRELLAHAGSLGIVLRRPGSKSLMLADNMPVEIGATYDLRQTGFFDLVGDTFATLIRDERRLIRVIGTSAREPETLVETILDESELVEAMRAFASRIFQLSLVISLMTASLVYLVLQWLFVRPMRAMTASMVGFREDPEDGRRLIRPGRRTDEIGVAERELAEMQGGLRRALQQRARLAAIGTGVAKINHDLRNILATVQLVSDHLSSSEDPKVRRIAPTLLGAIDRAVRLCSQTLSFANEAVPPPKIAPVGLAALVAEVRAELVEAPGRDVRFDNAVAPDLVVDADEEQLFRVLLNLARNALEAGAKTLTVRAALEGDRHAIEVADDGPGLTRKARDNLFQAFGGSGKSGGTGLGLAIARDLLRGHGGDIILAESGPRGTRFRLFLPATVAALPPPSQAGPAAEPPPATLEVAA